MAWVMQVQQNHNTKKWPWLSTNIYHLFQRCPCKMMSKTSEAGIHMYMMKAHELMGVWGCRGREELPFFFVSCPLLTNTVRGSHDHSCCFHAFSFCMYVDAGQRVLPLSKHIPPVEWFSLIVPRRGWDQATSVFLSTALAWMVWSRGGGGFSVPKNEKIQ